MVQFCNKLDLRTPYLYFYGIADDWMSQFTDYLSFGDDRDFQETFVKKLEEMYNDKDCWMCVNAVPEEGIVVRKEDFFSCESYKLKSFRFLEFESNQLDQGEVDIESEN